MDLEKNEVPNIMFGRLKEAINVTGYTLERAMNEFKWLLEDDRWMIVGKGYDDINEFLKDIKLSEFKILANDRKEISVKLAELQATQRATADALGVGTMTINRDITDDVPNGTKNTNSEKNDADNEVVINSDIPNGTPDPPEPDWANNEGGEFVDKAINQETTKKKSIEQKKRHDEIIKNNNPEITGKYDVIVIDPPWDVQKIERDVAPNQSKELDYPVMTLQEISNIKLPSNDNCHLFLWTTQKYLQDAFGILDGWGVKYVLTMVWHKPGGFQPYNLPQYNAEFCLYGRIGTPIFNSTKSFFTCYNWKRGKHSEKPLEFYELIQRVTTGNRIDMFNRRKIKGFKTWGNESN